MTTGLRQAKRAALAQELATLAFDLVRRDGFARVTVEDIVTAANVSRRTFSNYYPCKEAAVAAVVGHRVGTALDAWAPPATGDVLGLIGDLVDHQLDQGALEVLGQVSALAAFHPQLVPYVREAQWQLWSAVGRRVLAALGDPAPQEVETVHLAVGALFSLVNVGWAVPGADGAGVVPGGPGASGLRGAAGAPGAAPADLHPRVRAALGRLRDGLGEARGE